MLRFRAGGDEFEVESRPHFIDHDVADGRQQTRSDRLVVHGRPVATAQILDPPGPGIAEHASVLSRDQGIVETNVAVARTPDEEVLDEDFVVLSVLVDPTQGNRPLPEPSPSPVDISARPWLSRASSTSCGSRTIPVRPMSNIQAKITTTGANPTAATISARNNQSGAPKSDPSSTAPCEITQTPTR